MALEKIISRIKIIHRIRSVNEFLRSFDMILVLIIVFIAYKTYDDTVEQLKITKQSLKSTQIANAWAIIGIKSVGAGGKADALELLAKEGKSLVGVDMSGITHKGNKKFLTEKNHFFHAKTATAVVNLDGMNLGFDRNQRISQLANAKFENTTLIDSNFSGADLTLTSFNSSVLVNANFEGAHITMTDFRDAQDLGSINFKNAYIFNNMDYNSNFYPKVSNEYQVVQEVNQTYRVTTLEEKMETSKQINNIIRKIESEQGDQTLRDLYRKKEKLESQKWLREDLGGHFYKVKIEKKKK